MSLFLSIDADCVDDVDRARHCASRIGGKTYGGDQGAVALAGDDVAGAAEAPPVLVTAGAEAAPVVVIDETAAEPEAAFAP